MRGHLAVLFFMEWFDRIIGDEGLFLESGVAFLIVTTHGVLWWKTMSKEESFFFFEILFSFFGFFRYVYF